MQYRGKKEMQRLPCKGSRKKSESAWNKPERVSLDKSTMRDAEGRVLGDVFVLNRTTLPHHTISIDFLESLSLLGTPT